MAYSTDVWHDFFVCAGSAAAALTGLIFVGLSINIRTVLELDRKDGHNFLTGRALEALTALLIVLAISLTGLTPAIPGQVLGAFIVLMAIGSAITPTLTLRASRHTTALSRATLARVVTAITWTACLTTAGATLIAGAGGGLYWLPAAFLLSISVAAINAWILLVEILR